MSLVQVDRVKTATSTALVVVSVILPTLSALAIYLRYMALHLDIAISGENTHSNKRWGAIPAENHSKLWIWRVGATGVLNTYSETTNLDHSEELFTISTEIASIGCGEGDCYSIFEDDLLV
jgi:hypothetical protein